MPFFLVFNRCHLSYITFKVVWRCSVAIKHKQEVIKTQTHNGQGGCQCAGTLQRSCAWFFVFSRKRHDTFELHRVVADTSCCSLCIFRFFPVWAAATQSCLVLLNGCAQSQNILTQNHPGPPQRVPTCLGSFLTDTFKTLFKNGGLHSLPRGEWMSEMLY